MKLSHYDETIVMADDAKIVKPKENIKLSLEGRSKDKHQTPTTRLNLYVRSIIESEAWPTIVQL